MAFLVSVIHLSLHIEYEKMRSYFLYPIICRNFFPAMKKQLTLFTLENNTGINFINKVENTKDFNIFTYRNFYNGGGVLLAILIMMVCPMFYDI
jgi:hypothetical protein